MNHEIWIEAESLAEHGGWVVDQQSMETRHSSYLMAHGMGIPVADAKGQFAVTEAGRYQVWALTRDWTAVWGAEDPAGKWSLAIDGRALPAVLGTQGKEWDFQYAGSIDLSEGEHTISLHDLTGFNGRCDAIYLTDSADMIKPASDMDSLDAMRKRLSWKQVEDHPTSYDLIVVGGGVAGTCMALSAIRSGVSTLLIQDRGVLGGCNSSEIRVCMGGIANLPPYPNLGKVLQEIAPVMGTPETFDAAYYEDNRKKFAFEVSGAKNRVRYFECVTEIETEGKQITAVISTHTLTGKKTRYKAKLFADCTGDGLICRSAGCATLYGREASETFDETLAPKEASNMVMGHSIRWYSEEKDAPVPFPDIDWKLPFTDANCLNVKNGDWEQESGYRRDMVREIEYIRDFGLRAIYSNWSYQKNHYAEKERFANSSLVWVSPLGGKRESYRVIGDHILTQNDIESHIEYPDATCCMTWSIDMHFPECDNDAAYEEPFRSFAYHRGIVKPYPVPYRCLYARDVDNLFLGGRIVSTSHVAFSSIRVMRTLGQLGEVVGLAAGICKKQNCLPRAVYTEHLSELKEAMARGVKIPQAFCCAVASEEAYHFKDIGWFNLNPYACDTPERLDKFKRGIKALGIKHKYPLPEELKDVEAD